ncbi:MAG: serine/threonine protein kinase, partial [Myxococcaceae bacterium]
ARRRSPPGAATKPWAARTRGPREEVAARPSIAVPSVAPLTAAPPPPPVAPVSAPPMASSPPPVATAAVHSPVRSTAERAPVAPPPPVHAVPPSPPPGGPVAARPPAATETPPASGKGLTPGQRRGMVVGGISVILAGLALVFVLPGGGVEVRNAQAGERVYVSGVLLAADRSLPEDPGGWLVSTAVDGRLRRFGKVSKAEHIDLRTLADAAPQADAKGMLSVTGPAGCRVALGSQVLESATPLVSPLPAGREFEVRVTCGGKPDVVRWVMAVPGQSVALDVP